jgi:hypothetical protein
MLRITALPEILREILPVSSANRVEFDPEPFRDGSKSSADRQKAEEGKK